MVDQVRQKCDEKKIIHSVKNLAEMSGFSETVVNNVLCMERRVQHVYLDDIYSLKEERMTLEEIVLQNEAKNLLKTCAYKDLPLMEYEFFPLP